MQYDLQTTAIQPSLEGPRDAYHIIVWRNGEQVFEQTYGVQNFTGGHYVMWEVVHLLQHAPDIMDEQLESSVPLPAEAWHTADDLPLSLYYNATWMSIVLFGSTSRRRGRNCLLKVNLAVETTAGFAHKPGEALDQFVSFGLYTTPEDVTRFGEDLEAEMVQARRLRDALNLPAAFETP